MGKPNTLMRRSDLLEGTKAKEGEKIILINKEK
jgi:hypothetical protein